MAWQTEMVQLLRYVINDIDSPSVYSDDRLQKTLVAAAQFLVFQVDFDQDYTLDISTPSISPDPTSDPRDEGFINLTVLQAACLIVNAEVKLKAGQSVLVKDGPSTIDTRGSYEATQQRYRDMMAILDQARTQYQLGNARAGQAVLGPYVQQYFPIYPGNFT